MPSSFSADSMTIAKLLSGQTLLQVPSYQRNYAWATPQISRLIDNLIENALAAPDQEYFLGSIILLRDPRHTYQTGHRFIVDGQQRLITITILMAALRDRIDTELSEVLAQKVTTDTAPMSPGRLEIRETTSAFFRKYIQEPGATDREIEPTDVTSATEALFNALQLIDEIVQNLNGDERMALAKFVLEQCVFIVVTSDQIDRAYSIFTVINDTGRELTRLEILKAQFLGALPSTRRSRIEDLWLDHERRLGQDFDKLLSHLAAANNKTKTSIITSVREIATEAPSIETFLDKEFFPAADALAPILGHARTSPEREKYFGYWRALRGENWIPPILAWMQENPDPAPDDLKFLKAFDRLAISLLLQGVGGEKRVSRYRTVANVIKQGGDVLAPASPIHPDKTEQRHALVNLSRRFYEKGQPLCRLIMLRINDHLMEQHGRPAPGVAFDYRLASIEHILPRNPPDGSIWRDWYADTDVRDYCTNCLGNLVLVTNKENHALKNKDFKTKKELILAGPSSDRFEITSMLSDYDSWRPEDVIRRDEHLLDIATTMFDLSGPRGLDLAGENRRQKLSALLNA